MANDYSVREPTEIGPHLHRLSSYAAAVGGRIVDAMPRSDRSIAYSNFCNYISGELKRAAGFFPEDTPGLAWVCRNLFETNLTVRYVLVSDQNFGEWMGQVLRDELDFIEGMLTLAQDGHATQKAVLLARKKHLDEMAKRYNLKFSRPFRMSDIARTVSEDAEYVAMYKLFSKYVHPSSLLINSWAKTEPETGWTNVFLASAQKYAADTIERLSEASRIDDAPRL